MSGIPIPRAVYRVGPLAHSVIGSVGWGGWTMMLPCFPLSDGDGGGEMPVGAWPFAIREGPEFGRMEGDVRGNGLGDEMVRSGWMPI